MTITHQIVNQSDTPIAPGGDIVSQLSGLLGQASALIGAGVGLPGIQGIGSQIAGMGSAITSAGTNSGSDSSILSNNITTLGSAMASGSMGSQAGILSSLTSQFSKLNTLLNPSGNQAQILHKHILDQINGILHSAFQGKHSVSLDNSGISVTSSAKVSTTAPTIPHNGAMVGSDTLAITGAVTGSSFTVVSDAEVKNKIDDHPSVLDKIMQLKLKTFDINKSIDWENNEANDCEPRQSIGLIAQEVKEIFPLIVHGNKFLSIEESKIGLLLLAAFQEFVIEVRKELKDMKNG